jgi:hypothetical protein
MDKKFVNICNSLENKKFQSSSDALKNSKDTNIDTAFMILGISQGLRDMGFINAPIGWTTTPDMGVISTRSSLSGMKDAILVVNPKVITEEKMNAIMKKYDDTRDKPQLEFEEEMGKLLGYFQPVTRENYKLSNNKISGSHKMILEVVDKSGGTIRSIISEFGPQTISLDKKIIDPIISSFKKWDTLAQKVNKQFFISVNIGIDSINRLKYERNAYKKRNKN